MKTFIFSLVLVVSATLLSCNNFRSEVDSFHMMKVFEYISEFETTRDSSYLYKAQDLINKIEDNPNVYNAAKVSLFCHFKEFENAAKYFETLNDSTFSVSYQKAIGINTYMALDAEMRKDTILRNSYISKNIQLIQNHINSLPKADFNSYYDLFLFKSQLDASEKTYNEFVDSMKSLGVPDQEIALLYNNLKNCSIIKIVNPFFDSEENTTEAKVMEMTEEEYIENNKQ
ncbi:MAG: hypothetical protein IKV83_04650 [Muribaculaceae bacterium]|nr:hypothetical protein [Muribaculaceae bacterium]